MSIVSTVKVYDGLVMAADSSAQIIGQDISTGAKGIIKTYDYSNKLFQFRDFPVGVLSYGIGNIGSRSIQSLLFEVFGDSEKIGFGELIEETRVKYIAEEALAFFKGKYDEFFKDYADDEKPYLGFIVGGYSGSSFHAEEWEFVLPKLEDIVEVRPKEHFGASWRGVSIPFTRLYRGIDPRIENKLREEGVSEEIIAKIHHSFESKFIFDGMPLQDAIDLARFIISSTIEMARFEMGPPACGGPIDIAVITPDNKFNWIQKKQLK